MKLFTVVLLLLTLLASCANTPLKDEEGKLTQEGVMQTYTSENRGINLSEMDLAGFVSLNGLTGDEEIVNIDVSNNNIEVLNISEYTDLGRIIASNNQIVYFNDIKYPTQIRHIVLDNNLLETLDGIEKLTELKTLDVSHNKLDEEDFKKLVNLEKLQLIYAEGNDVSNDFLKRLAEFNRAYLGTIKE